MDGPLTGAGAQMARIPCVIVEAAPPQVVAAMIDGHAVQPRRDGGFARKARPAARGLEEDIMCEVIRVGAVLYISPTDPPDVSVMACIQFPEAFPHHACTVAHSVCIAPCPRSLPTGRTLPECDHVVRTSQRACRRAGARREGRNL